MQIAGEDCAGCGNRIISALEGIGCPACLVPFHRTCVDDSGKCPKCQNELAEHSQTAAQVTPEEVEAAAESLRGDQACGYSSTSALTPTTTARFGPGWGSISSAKRSLSGRC